MAYGLLTGAPCELSSPNWRLGLTTAMSALTRGNSVDFLINFRSLAPMSASREVGYSAYSYVFLEMGVDDRVLRGQSVWDRGVIRGGRW